MSEQILVKTIDAMFYFRRAIAAKVCAEACMNIGWHYEAQRYAIEAVYLLAQGIAALAIDENKV